MKKRAYIAQGCAYAAGVVVYVAALVTTFMNVPAAVLAAVYSGDVSIY